MASNGFLWKKAVLALLFCALSLFVMDVGSNLISRKEGKWQSVNTNLSQESQAQIHVLPTCCYNALQWSFFPRVGVSAGCWALSLLS